MATLAATNGQKVSSPAYASSL